MLKLTYIYCVASVAMNLYHSPYVKETLPSAQVFSVSVVITVPGDIRDALKAIWYVPVSVEL